MKQRERIEKEIRDHDHWCSKKCITFNHAAYRKARMELNLPKSVVQKAKPLCHDME